MRKIALLHLYHIRREVSSLTNYARYSREGCTENVRACEITYLSDKITDLDMIFLWVFLLLLSQFLITTAWPH